LCSKKRGQLLNLAVTVANALEAAKYKNEQQKRQATKLVSKIETTTMVCISEQCELLKLNRTEFRAFNRAHPVTGKKLQSVLSADLIDYLKNIPFLKDLPTSKLILFSRMCSYEAFQKGQDIFRENDPGTSMSICLFGKCEISTLLEPLTPNISQELPMKAKTFATVSPGDFFGEMSLIIEMPRLATVTAIETSLVITVDKRNFCNFIKVVPELGTRLREDVQRRMMEKLHACKIPFFSGIGLEKLLSLNKCCDIVEAAPNQVIIEQGQHSSNFYMVVCGKCDITRRVDEQSTKKVLVNTCGPGSYFGELSMVLHEETRATVTATEQSVLLSISPEHFPRFFGGSVHMMAEVRIRMCGDRVALRHFLTHNVGREIFSAHLHREHSEEHLLMYDAIVKHEAEFECNEEDTSAEKRLKNMIIIYEEYIKEGSPREVNIPATMKDEISAQINAKTATIGRFTHIKNEVHRLMEMDNFVRFKHGAEFKAFLEEIGGPYSGVPKKTADSHRLSIQMKSPFV